MGDTIAQTRFKNVCKHYIDSLLARGNTLPSDEDRLKLDELMALCTTLQNRVLDLEQIKTTQHNEIARHLDGIQLNDLKLKGFDSIQEMFDRAFKRVNTFEEFRTELVEGKEMCAV
ncbi:hypothetical protein Tco_0908617 [Tanacetum coccineum]|uniref:Uncharacterized protein n=1 Tax=Tanacetum coccineum TaxID=301880 RepID=A0ABQ5CPS9_9ASTR